LVLENKAARFILEDLQKKNFQINKTSIQFLFEKLLKEPLLRITTDLYLILDGLDEADITTIDETERVSLPEMNVLIECLAMLPSVRLLFISRPSYDISQIVPNLVKKPIASENQNDIDVYVRKTIDSSKRLQDGFKSANVDHFQEKENNIFLWVVLVLNDLARAKINN
jgi:hypothetical protein